MTRKTTFFAGWSWFKFNNLGLALSIALKFYSSVAKGLKQKFKKFWELIPTFVEVTGEKLVGGWGWLFALPILPPNQNRINIFCWNFTQVSYLPMSTKGYSEFFSVLFRSWAICQNKKRPGFCTLTETSFINISDLNTINPEHPFVDIGK